MTGPLTGPRGRFRIARRGLSRLGLAGGLVAVGAIVLTTEIVLALLDGEPLSAGLARLAVLVALVVMVVWLAWRNSRATETADLAQTGEWQALQERLTRQAFHDPLTGLPNRALFIDRLDHALGRRRAKPGTVAVLFLDLDDFKAVNDTLGHVEGDLLIALVAGRLAETTRPEDTCARLGGDEFAVLLEDADADGAQRVAERILAALASPFELTERPVRIGASVGIALNPSVTTAHEMVRAADLAMYAAKGSGKNQVCVFEAEMLTSAADRMQLGIDIRGALEANQFVLHYQPQVLLPTGTVVAMEALVRWAHPERGVLLPEEFLSLAEETGTIIPVGEWVLENAIKQARAWERARPGQAPVGVCVNVSSLQIQHGGFVAAVGDVLSRSGLSPELLTLEVSEAQLARESDHSVHRLRQLKELGVKVAIDDFGTGASSLGYLRRFPVDVVKVDPSFVSGIGTGSEELALVRAMVRLAHSMSMTVVAEGVEDEAQSRRLSSIGCDRAQGFLFGSPADASVAMATVRGQRTLSFWVGHEGHELEVIKSVVADFEAANPGLRVDVLGGMVADRVVAVLNGPQVPNVISTFESDPQGSFSGPDGLVDLAPYLGRDGIEASTFTDASESYTRYRGRRWALPLLADATGLYLNRALLREGGFDAPPRSVSALSTMARKLTKRHRDGSLAVVGFNPLLGFYENSLELFGHLFGARWTDDRGRSCLGTDPAWVRMLRWQKQLVDWYGYADLVRFGESAGEEFSPSNAFATGRLAMMLDGEWRIAFLADEVPELDYLTAPAPVDDERPELYGSGYVNGSIIGIPAQAGQRADAWKLVRYLATDDEAIVKLAKGLHNLPSTRSTLERSDLVNDPRFAVFMDVYAHPRSTSTPSAMLGSTRRSLFLDFAVEWQQGRVPDLHAGLRALDDQIDELSQRTAPESRAAQVPTRSEQASFAEGSVA